MISRRQIRQGNFEGLRPDSPSDRAGIHLLSVLAEKLSVRYSFFYDGTNETADRIRKCFGLDKDDGTAELLIDDAAAEFAEFGYVTLTRLDDRLADAENDYEILLTDAGKELLHVGENK